MGKMQYKDAFGNEHTLFSDGRVRCGKCGYLAPGMAAIRGHCRPCVNGGDDVSKCTDRNTRDAETIRILREQLELAREDLSAVSSALSVLNSIMTRETIASMSGTSGGESPPHLPSIGSIEWKGSSH